jgi:hypothetical protein
VKRKRGGSGWQTSVATCPGGQYQKFATPLVKKKKGDTVPLEGRKEEEGVHGVHEKMLLADEEEGLHGVLLAEEEGLRGKEGISGSQHWGMPRG